ncbi:DUF6220 domain-containing protein [Planomonospora venezuelensis]|uniref:Uncharacterized protein n=1 Tax=Planomonospora venezuelensis TaxID=1999 RepID=A0A841DBH3_PLAVE|nr:hypothetical protein [Planomonospora venezuelensis]GIN03113.1 hypothetical protein Pve01_47710 [Planomonospora venezuelensis]
MRKVFLSFAALLLLAVLVQFYLATFGAFQRPLPTAGDPGALTPHVVNGLAVIPLLSLATTIVAAVARAGARLVWLSVSPVGIAAAQIFVIFPLVELAGADGTRTTTASHAVLGFHAVLGLLLLWATVVVFREARSLAVAAGRTAADRPAAASHL